MSSSSSSSVTVAASAVPSSPESVAPSSPTSPKGTLPTLAVEFPSDHPVARRQAQIQASASSSSQTAGFTAPTVDANEAYQAFLLQRHSQQLSVPTSPQEQRRRSINPSSRRNSILAIPPANPEGHPTADHIPEAGHDIDVDQAELEKELEEIDTIG